MTYQEGNKVGQGLRWPPRYIDGHFEELQDEELVQNGMDNVLNVDASSRDGIQRGELRFNMRFGSQLRRLTHMRMRGMEQDVGRVYILDPLTRWEPRAEISMAGTKVRKSLKTSRAYYFRVAFRINPEYSGRQSTEAQHTEVDV